MTLRILLLSLCVFLAMPLSASGSEGESCPIVKMDVERLPDLHVARYGHSLFCVGGELTVVGGHTSGFVPTPTAEYYADGEWHLLNTVYPHDDGCSFFTPQGHVVLIGGHSEPLGIGQTFFVERYDAAAHRFQGFSCLDTKRVLSSAAVIDSGRVVVSGNWYHDDATELFDGHEHFAPACSVSVQRARPIILPTSDGDALIFSSIGHRGAAIDASLADRLYGPPLRLPLFQQWQTNCIDDFRTAEAFIGTAADGAYCYLLPVHNAEGRQAIVLMQDTVATLLPTVSPVPREGPGGRITWIEVIVADTTARRAYMAGIGSGNRLFVLAIDYDRRPAPLTLYHTTPLPAPALSVPVLMPDGRIALVGSNITMKGDTAVCNNYTPYATAYLLSLQPAAAATTGASCWWWIAAALVALAAAAACWLLRRKKTPETACEDEAADIADHTQQQPTEKPTDKADLFARICQLMEQEHLYLKSNLKVSDVAALLDTSSGVVSECVKAGQGTTFTQFVNTYRIAYAQQLLLQQPDLKMSVLCSEVGFANETSFFRTFKAITGDTPREWLRNKKE